MLTLHRFRRIEAALRRRGYGDSIDWSENIAAAEDPEDFAERAIYVICNSGFRNSVAEPIFYRCVAALREGRSATTEFKHPGKAPAIDQIWNCRAALFSDYQQADDPIAFLEQLPWIGSITALHLGKNLGLQFAKPDVHMERLARRENTTTAKLCARLAQATGYRVPTIDTVLWRACADGLINSSIYETHGWAAAISAEITREAWTKPIAVKSAAVIEPAPQPES